MTVASRLKYKGYNKKEKRWIIQWIFYIKNICSTYQKKSEDINHVHNYINTLYNEPQDFRHYTNQLF